MSAYLKGKRVLFDAFAVDKTGLLEQGKEIDVLFGSLAMRRRNIDIKPKEGKIDLSRCPNEFVEF